MYLFSPENILSKYCTILRSLHCIEIQYCWSIILHIIGVWLRGNYVTGLQILDLNNYIFSICIFLNLSMLWFNPGGGVLNWFFFFFFSVFFFFFFGGCMTGWFPKVGSKERIFLEKIVGLGIVCFTDPFLLSYSPQLSQACFQPQNKGLSYPQLQLLSPERKVGRRGSRIGAVLILVRWLKISFWFLELYWFQKGAIQVVSWASRLSDWGGPRSCQMS